MTAGSGPVIEFPNRRRLLQSTDSGIQAVYAVRSDHLTAARKAKHTYCRLDKAVIVDGSVPIRLFIGSTSDVTGPLAVKQPTPAQLHGDDPTSQLLLFVHPAPYVATNRSTRAHRSALPQYDSGEVQLTMQLVDHMGADAGKSVATPGGSVPVN